MNIHQSHYVERELSCGFETGGVLEVTEVGEWEGLIGLFECFLDADLNQVDQKVEGGRVQLFFPVSLKTQQKYGLMGVNDYSSNVLALLHQHNFLYHFDEKHLDPVNPEEL
jgi:hypothetical protein